MADGPDQGIASMADGEETAADTAKDGLDDKQHYRRQASDYVKIRNWPFSIKFSIAPMIAMGFMVLIAMIGATGIEKLEGNLDKVVNRNLEGGLELSAINKELFAVNGAVYRVTSLMASGVKLDVIAEFEHIRDRVDNLLAHVTAYRSKPYVTADQRRQLDEVVSKLSDYKVQVDTLSVLAEVDLPTAIKSAQPFDNTFADLGKALDASVAEMVADGAAQVRQTRLSNQQTINQFMRFTLLALAVVLISAVLLGRATVVSIRQIATATRDLAQGNHDVDIDGLRRMDELRAIVTSLRRFRDYIIQADDAEREKEEARRNADAIRLKALGEMAESIDRETAKVVGIVGAKAGEMQSAAIDMDATSGRMAAEASEAASVAQDALDTAQTVAAAASQLSQAIDTIGIEVNQAHSRTEVAVEQTIEVQEVIRSLANSAAQIGSVVEIISGIADQTNMLALNATIEAARAGETGRGFAVVASEVKALAQQTADATNEIASQVKAIQTSSQQAATTFEQVTQSIRDLGHISNTIAASINEQMASTQEIASAIHHSATVSKDVAGRMQRLLDEVGETSRLAQFVKSSADELSVETSMLGDTLAGIVRKATEDQEQERV